MCVPLHRTKEIKDNIRIGDQRYNTDKNVKIVENMITLMILAVVAVMVAQAVNVSNKLNFRC
jgi:uncharacterized protein (DUF486 family)